MPPHAGELAALLTAACWSINSIFFTLAGRRVGSGTVNHLRLWIALAAMLVIHFLTFGSLFPAADPEKWLWFGISALLGYIVGDAFWLEALVLIGPRLSQLLMILAPVMSAFFGWVILGETLTLAETGGITLTVGGIAWVVTGPKEKKIAAPGKYTWGILCGLIGALGQAGGYLFSKIGLEGGFSPISGNLIRLAAATPMIVLVSVIQGKTIAHFRSLADRRSLAQIAAGALLGPVLGVSLSLFALAHSPVGISSTLMSLSPVLLIPISHFLFGEKITRRTVLGTIVSLAGTTLLFLF